MKYNKGSIIRIYLESFLAFDRIELSPRNKLNLIVGANGSGKSTFVCAIVLGLGGKPTIIGRSPNVSDFVKHGREKAIIELELYNPDGDNYVLSRHITSTSQSSWYLQNKSVPFKKVEGLIESLNIQINNLCQILPQDRVHDFAKMNSKELLENTQKSVGNPELFEAFNKLKSFRTSFVERQALLSEKLRKYEAEVQKNKRMEQDVRNFQEKQDILDKIVLIKKKLRWLLYEEKKESMKKAEEDLLSAQANYEREKIRMKPLLRKIQEIEKEQTSLQKKIKAETDKNSQLNNNLKNFVRTHLRLKDKIDNLKQELKSKLDAEKQKEKRIAEIERDIQKMEEHLPNVNDASLVADIKKADSEIDTILKKVAQARNSEGIVRNESMTINQALRALEFKVQQLNSVREKKLEILANFEDVKKAYEWLQVNRNHFQGNIYGPLFMEINVQNQNHARYLEHIVSWKDLVAFVCENAKDMTKLLTILRDQKKFKINAVHSAPPDRSLAEMFPPRVPITELRRFGFQAYLVELIEGCDVILKYLCTSVKIHMIPVGTSQVQEHMQSIPADIRMFFTDNSFHKINYSRYSGEKLHNVTEVGRSRFLSISVNADLLRACTDELRKKQEENQEVQRRLSEMAELKNSYDIEINSLRNKKRELSKTLEQLKACNVRLRMKREDLAEIVTRKIDAVAEEANTKINIEACLKELVTNAQEEVKTIASYSDSCISLGLAKLQNEPFESLLKNHERELRNIEAGVIAARDEAEKLKSEFVQIRIELRDIHKKAKELSEDLDITDERFKQKYGPLFKELPDNRLDLEDHLHETDAMAKCLQGNFDDKVLKEYEESSKLIRALEKEVERLKLASTGIQEEAVDVLTFWLPSMLKLIDEINDRFSAFFAAMGCAGLVELDQGVDQSAYENYGLRIKVKFRNEGELQALDSHTQSGGERALTTAVYLLSLQAITNVPFRCVDEINQGMDEINEKRVYHLIMNIISTRDSAQYFLVTPTLFPNVDYPDGTCVHCIHASASDINLPNFKEKMFQRLGIEMDL